MAHTPWTPGVFSDPGMMAINRPFKSWDYELGDPAWRRWFDILKENNVTGLADSAIGALKGMWSTPGQSRRSTYDPNFQSSALGGQQTPSNDLGAGSRALEGLLAQGRMPRGSRRRGDIDTMDASAGEMMTDMPRPMFKRLRS